MIVYKCKVGYGFMNEDELPDDIPQDIYDWWFLNSHVDGVRIGPIIESIKGEGDV